VGGVDEGEAAWAVFGDPVGGVPAGRQVRVQGRPVEVVEELRPAAGSVAAGGVAVHGDDDGATGEVGDMTGVGRAGGDAANADRRELGQASAGSVIRPAVTAFDQDSGSMTRSMWTVVVAFVAASAVHSCSEGTGDGPRLKSVTE
jgi:hypothetical protein